MQRYYSTVYWHFTGGPKCTDGHRIRRRSDILELDQKEPDKAFDIAKKILCSGYLRATATERIIGNLKTDRFCCVCDIPFKDLTTHAECYGEVAIGFSAQSIQRKFNPVLYIDYNKLPFNDSLSISDDTVLGDENTVISNADDSAFNFFEFLFNSKDGGCQLAKSLDNTLGSLESYIKFTEFSDKDEDMLYGEREWRCIERFNFGLEDIEAVIVPKEYIVPLREFLVEQNDKVEISLIAYEFLEKA